MNDSPFPPGWVLVPDRKLRRRQAGRLLIGGSPLRFLRLSEAGARRVDQWFCGHHVGTGPAEIRLARRLLDIGMAHPALPPLLHPKSEASLDLTVVIPVKDDPAGLATTLSGINSLAVVIVDDGSQIPISVDEFSNQHLVIVRNQQSVGPGPARNLGLARVATDTVAFVDAGVGVSEKDLLRLVGHLLDPEVVATAPRIRSRSSEVDSSPISTYETSHSPLDLGNQPARVHPGFAVSYVPTACLVARVCVLRGLAQSPDGPFDRSFRYGEDVDLEWRLCQEGRIRYEPSVVVTHPPRPDVRSFVEQRIGYGSAAGPLAAKHGTMVAPYRTSRWTISILSLVLFGHPLLASVLASTTSILMSRRLGARVPDREIEALRITTGGHLRSGVALGETALRAWWPVALFGLALPLLRRPAFNLVAWGLANRAWISRDQPGPRRKAVQMAIGLLDDFSYGLGLWKGAIKQGSFLALRPDFKPVSTEDVPIR